MCRSKPPRKFAWCNSHLYIVESCWRWAAPQLQYLHPSITVCPVFPVVLASASRAWARGSRKGGTTSRHFYAGRSQGPNRQLSIENGTNRDSCPAKSPISTFQNSSRMSRIIQENWIPLHPQPRSVQSGFRGQHFRESQPSHNGHAACTGLSVAACVTAPATLLSTSLLPVHYISSDFTQAVLLQSLSWTKDTDRRYLFNINKSTYWIYVQALTVLLMPTYRQYTWNSMNHTQNWHKQNPMNIYKYVPAICKHCKYHIFLWWWWGIIWEFSAVQLFRGWKDLASFRNCNRVLNIFHVTSVSSNLLFVISFKNTNKLFSHFVYRTVEQEITAALKKYCG